MTPEDEMRVRNIRTALVRSYEEFGGGRIFEGKAALEEAWIINAALATPSVEANKGKSGASHPADTPIHNNIILARILRDLASLRPSRSPDDYGVATADVERQIRLVSEMFNTSAAVVSKTLEE